MNILKKVYNLPKKYYIILCFFLSLSVILMPRKLWIGSDDTVYQAQITEMGIFPWIWLRATTWQPRLLSDFLIALFNFNTFTWKICTSLMCTFMLLMICKFSDCDKEEEHMTLYTYAIVCSSFFLIPPKTFSGSISWYTGSCHYIWPTIFLIIAIIPFYCALTKTKIKYKFTHYIAILASLLTGYHEQCTAIFLCFGIITFASLFFRKEKLPKHLILQFVFVLINLCIYFSLGGNEMRSTLELHWYKDFPMLSTTDKIFQGINWGNYVLFHSAEMLMCIVSGLILILAFKTQKSFIVKFIATIPFFSFAIGILPINTIFSNICNLPIDNDYKLQINDILSSIFNPMKATPGNFESSLSSLFSSFFCLFIVLLIGGLIFFLCKDIWTSFANMLLYFAALFSSYALGFSPTIFASGHRIFLVTDVLLIVIISLLLKQLKIQTNFCNGKVFKIVSITIVIFSIFFIIQDFYNNFIGVTFP